MNAFHGHFPAPGSGGGLTPDLGLLLSGGRTLLAFAQGGATLPQLGTCGTAAWRAAGWPGPDGGPGLAVVDAPLIAAARLQADHGAAFDLAPPRAIDVAPGALADMLRRHAISVAQAHDFLVQALGQGADATLRAPDAAFLREVLLRATDGDGVIEILACPETGGVFAQGWALSLAPGRRRLLRLDGALAPGAAEVAVFAREDIPAPGSGFCLFSRDWAGVDLNGIDVLFHEHDGALRRLDVLGDTLVRLRGAAAADHVRHMLPRLSGEGAAVGAHRRLCRPRYAGADTLSPTALPIAAHFDLLARAPGGGLLAAGWLLDPLRRVERILVKGKDGFYAPLQNRWIALPRPDLNDGFAADPRFARLLDAGETTHGFLAYAPAPPPPPVPAGDAGGDEAMYLELVLDDGSCLFRPLNVPVLDGHGALPRILAHVPPADPAMGPLVRDVLAPFLARLPRGRRPARPLGRPIPLSPEAGEVTAVIPVARFDHLQPIMALLAGTPEAGRLDLVIVLSRDDAGRAVERLTDLFAFYGLRGRLVLVPARTEPDARVEAGCDLAQGPRVLIWWPSALPAAPGWLARLEAEMAGLPGAGLISPTLTYEDGSVFFGGDGTTGPDDTPMLGYPRAWMMEGAPRRVPAGAAQVALIDRAALAAAGGYAGTLFSGAFAHRDLAHRLQAQGFGTWALHEVDFWMLEDLPAPSDDRARLLRAVDTELLSQVATPLGDRTA